MDLLFLGTCACDYSQKLKTEFVNSFDKDARRSSCALLNGKYLIDCGEHAMQSLSIAKIDLNAITDVFITHLHSDHYKVANIIEIASKKSSPLRLWVREDAIVPSIDNVEINYMKIGVNYVVDSDLTIKGLRANHDSNSFPQHILFEIKDKTLFYACDGAWFINDTYYALKDLNLSMIVLDATCGDYLGDYRIGEHNTIPMIRVMLPSLKEWGAINGQSKVYISHIAPSLHKPHDEIVKSVVNDGINVAYDGLKVEF